MRSWLSVWTTVALVALACAPTSHPDVDGPTDIVPVIKPTILAEIPHDSAAYTEGLQLDGTALYEATGLERQSQLRELDPSSGAVRRSAALRGNYFGEGIAVVGDRIWQLIYKDAVAIEWDKRSFAPLREVVVDGPGWGLCLDGDRLIRSDGSDRLHFHASADMAEIGSIAITRAGVPVRGLDELECVDGQVWASVWPTDELVRIDPATGQVNLAVDGSGLWRGGPRNHRQVMSSIAHVSGDEFLLVGKEWPWMVRVRIDGAS